MSTTDAEKPKSSARNPARGPERSAADAPMLHYTAFVVPHTHWDREWYEPFQVFRAQLVEVIDEVLTILQHQPHYRHFTLDGQAIILEDYLEIRPEKREVIREQVQAKRLHIGPWYVLADEFLVSPEALIRNLMLGQRICRAFGEPMPLAYTPDSFGHISQLPLIAQGFGLGSIVFERGVGDEGERLRDKFRWLAADGRSEVFAVHLLGTYSAAAALGHRDWELHDGYDASHAVRQVRALLFGSRDDISHLPAWLKDSIHRLPRGITSYSVNGSLLLLNGSDHLRPQANLPEVLDDLNASFPHIEFVHSDLEAFISAARQPLETLETHQGEFRGSRYQHVLSGVLSTRIYLKQANYQAETLLEHYAEPLSSWAWLEGAPYPHSLLWQTWRLLLRNHPHDSICGCSVDAVHREMMTRFEGALQLGEEFCQRAIKQLIGPAGTSAVTVFNPLPYPRTVVVEQVLELPAGSGSNLQVRDEAGTNVPAQTSITNHYPAGRSDQLVDRVKLRFLAILPPFSLQGYQLSAGARPEDATGLEVTEAGGHFQLRNAQLLVDIDPAGKITLTDRTSSLSYELNARFEDVADAGDSYDFSPLEQDVPLYMSQLQRPPVLLEAGPLSASVRLEYLFEVPAHLSTDRRQREGSTSLPIELELSLQAESHLLMLRLTITNQAKDHRLRLHLSSGCQTDCLWAGGSFDVQKRPLQPPAGKDWFQRPQPTSHQRHFVAVSEGARGLAILNRGLPEYQAIPTDSGVDLAITLLRSVGWLSREDLRSRPQGAGPSMPTPEAQCLGTNTFELAIYPFRGPWWESRLVEEVQGFIAPARAFLTRDAVNTKRLLELSPPLILSSLKRAEQRESLIVRVWNPSTEEVHGALDLAKPPVAAYLVSLAEIRQQRLTIQDSRLPLTLGAKEVRTLELVLERRGP